MAKIRLIVVIRDRKNLDLMLLTAISTDLKNGRTTCFWGRFFLGVVSGCIDIKVKNPGSEDQALGYPFKGMFSTGCIM